MCACLRVYVCVPIKVLIKSKRCADLFMRLEFPTVAWANIFATLVANGFYFFFGINKRRTQTKQTKETASLTNDHKQREGERERESEQREQSSLALDVLQRQRESFCTRTHTHTVRAKIFCIEYSAQRKTIENHLSNILYCLLQPFSIDRIQLFILEHATAKATIVFVFALKN